MTAGQASIEVSHSGAFAEWRARKLLAEVKVEVWEDIGNVPDFDGAPPMVTIECSAVLVPLRHPSLYNAHWATLALW